MMVFPPFIRSQQSTTIEYFANSFLKYFETFLINDLKFLTPKGKKVFFPMPKNMCNVTYKLVLVIRFVDF